MGLPNCTRSLAYSTVIDEDMVGGAEHLRAGQRGGPVEQQPRPPRRRRGTAPACRRRPGRRARACGPWPTAGRAALRCAGRRRRRRRRRRPRPRRPRARRRSGGVCAAEAHLRPSGPRRGGEPARAGAKADAADRGALGPAPRASPSVAGVGPRLVAAQRAERHDGREERRGHQAAPDLLAEHGDLDHAQPQAALVLGQLDRQPALVGHGRPRRRRRSRCGGRPAAARHRAAVPSPAPGQRPDDRPGPDPGPQRVGPGHPVEQRRRGVAQRLLVGREVEVHGGAVYGRPLTRVSPVAAAVPCCGGWICTPRPSRSRCATRSGPGCMEHLPWPYGVGLPPRFDDLAETVAFGRRWQADLAADRLGRPHLARGVRRPRPRRARELRGDRGAGPGAGPRAGRPHRHQPGRAHAAGPRDARAEGALPAADPLGRRAVVPALQRARRRERPGVAHDPRRAGRRRLPGERAQGVDVLRAVRRLGPLPHPQRPRRAQAPAGHHRAHRRHARRGRAACTRSCSRPGRPSSTRSSWTTSSCRPSSASAPRAPAGRVAGSTLAHERGINPRQLVIHTQLIEELLRLADANGSFDDWRLRQQLAQAATEVRLFQLHNWRSLTRLSKGEAPGPEGSALKLYWSEMSKRLHQTALDVLGAGLAPVGGGAGEPRRRRLAALVALLPGVVHLRRHQRDPADAGRRARPRAAPGLSVPGVAGGATGWATQGGWARWQRVSRRSATRPTARWPPSP